MHLNVAKHSHDYNPRTVATAHLRLFIIWGAVHLYETKDSQTLTDILFEDSQQVPFLTFFENLLLDKRQKFSVMHIQ